MQGQGIATEWKQRGISAAFELNLTVAKKIPWYPYLHFDINCGSGYNCEADCIGSPLAFIEKAEEMGFKNFRAFFVDRDAELLDILMRREEIRDRSDCYLFNCDNADFISAIPDLIRIYNPRPEMCLGSIFCDPNGTDIPFKELANLFDSHPRLDVIVNWNATSMKRTRKAFGKEMFRVEDLPSLFGKQHWLIREPISRHQFALVIGRNMRFGEHKAIGFHHLDSHRGKEIARKLDLTSREMDEEISYPKLPNI